MPHIRIATAGASLLFFLAVTLGSAAAQSETTGPVGKPLPLLQFTRHTGETRLPSHPKLAAIEAKKKKPSRPRIARHIVAKPHREIADARPAPAPSPVAPRAAPESKPENTLGNTLQNTWPTADVAAQGVMPTLTPDQPPPSVTTEPTVDADPNQIVTGSHSVQAALPDGLNRAGPPADPDPIQAAAPPANSPPKTTAVASAAPVVHAMVVTAEPQNPIGSASWLAQVLAALGGAIAAGAVAWFLIRPAPVRTYE